MDQIHDKFVTSVQSMESRYVVFDVITEWIGHLNPGQYEELSQAELKPEMLNKLRSFLETEQDTWSLILMLYFYRLQDNVSKGDDFIMGDDDDMESGIDIADDEVSAVARITDKDHSLKEIKTILEWLESNASKRQEPDLLEKFINWEQTLESLKREVKLDLKGTKPMVTRMDPDACFREDKGIHPVDSEDDSKAMQAAFYYVRSGQYLKAIEYLFESGHVATAAMLNGATYTEKIPLNFECDSTRAQISYDDGMEITAMDDGDGDTNNVTKINMESQGYAVLGNSERDIWKYTAFEVCEANGLSKYARAALGALCGHRKSVLDVAATWEDKLWAYLKIMYDMRVESELRRLSTAELVALPDEYWAQESSLSDCMNQALSDDTDFAGNLHKVFRLVQKHIITDDIDGLLKALRVGLAPLLAQPENTVVTGHLFRFVTHLFLMFGVVGLSYEEDLMNICTEAYIKVLARGGKLACIPFYVEKLSSEKQIPVIVDQINPNVQSKRDQIEFFMQAAHVNNLDVLKIGSGIVAKLRDSQEHTFDVESLFWITSCLQLVPDSREVMLAFLENSIILTRKFLTLNDLAKCNQFIRQIDDTCIEDVLSLSEGFDETLVRECFCYKVYLEAEDSFLLYQRSLRQQPRAEQDENASASLMELSVAERTLQEKKNQDLKIAESKWQKAMNHHLKNCIEKYFSILLFPNGWLVDCVTATNEAEFNNVKAVRRLLLPKVVFVLINLIKEQNSLANMRKLVYILCEDSREILREFTTIEISSIFKAVEEFIRKSSTTLSVLPK